MRKIISILAALSVVLCLSACKPNGGGETTTTAEPTTTSVEDNNRSVYARMGFEEILIYVNACEVNGYEIPVTDNTTCNEIIEYIKGLGGDLKISGINTSVRFLDYAKESNDKNTGSKYVLRDDVDWLFAAE